MDSQMFYTSPLVTAANYEATTTQAQKRDRDLCVSLRLFLKFFLLEDDINVAWTYVGFESMAMCASLTKEARWLEKGRREDGWKCDRSTSGYYTPVCRGWYKLQQNNPEKTTLGDLY